MRYTKFLLCIASIVSTVTARAIPAEDISIHNRGEYVVEGYTGPGGVAILNRGENKVEGYTGPGGVAILNRGENEVEGYTGPGGKIETWFTRHIQDFGVNKFLGVAILNRAEDV
ncbi:hypothetical protein B0O99DRAFT_684035 [Bisporella sp. PMI_857]|nr:hypothetical protein B0O99DRAFT_684035 [Bisporella sp. PMI_857]